MPIRLKEWTQREWYNAGTEVYRASGDLDLLDCLLPGTFPPELKRAPSWSSLVAFPDGFGACRAAFYDYANQRYVFIGQNGDDHLASCYASSAWSMSAVTEIIAASTQTGGLFGQNCLWWGGDLYVILTSANVYRGSSYSAAITQFYTGGDAQALCPAGDRMYMATTGGDIMRLNAADAAFEAYFTPVADLDVRYLAPYRGYLLVVTRTEEGRLQIHRLPTDATSPALDTMATIPPATADNALAGLLATKLFAIYDDELYFSPGRDSLVDGGKGINLYAFNGSQVRHVAPQPLITADPYFFGFIPWRHHLALFDLSSTAQTFQTLVGRRFTGTLPELSDTLPSYKTLFNLGGDLVLLTTDGAGGEGIRYTSSTALEDGYLQTPRLDMGSPALAKKLHQITALLDGAASGFKVLLKYRTDDTATWTTAATANNTQRAAATGIDQTFYTLQVQLLLDDDSEGNQDIRVESLSVLYSIDT